MSTADPMYPTPCVGEDRVWTGRPVQVGPSTPAAETTGPAPYTLEGGLAGREDVLVTMARAAAVVGPLVHPRCDPECRSRRDL